MRVFTSHTDKITKITSIAESQTTECDIHIEKDHKVCISIRENGMTVKIMTPHGWQEAYDAEFDDEIEKRRCDNDSNIST